MEDIAMRRTVMPFIFLLFLSAGCGSDKDALTVKAMRPELHLTNTSSETIYYVVYPARVLAYVTIRPTCTDENSISPGSTTKLSYDTILQTGPDEEAVVYWWHCKEGSTTQTVANAHVVKVTL